MLSSSDAPAEELLATCGPFPACCVNSYRRCVVGVCKPFHSPDLIYEDWTTSVNPHSDTLHIIHVSEVDREPSKALHNAEVLRRQTTFWEYIRRVLSENFIVII